VFALLRICWVQAVSGQHSWQLRVCCEQQGSAVPSYPCSREFWLWELILGCSSPRLRLFGHSPWFHSPPLRYRPSVGAEQCKRTE